MSPQDCGCPPGVKAEEEDCNDSDPALGPYITTKYNPQNSTEPYYTCNLNPCRTQSEDFAITGDTIWHKTMNHHINQNIVIHSGSTLTIHCEVFMSSGAKIIIQPNAALVLKKEVLSSLLYRIWLNFQVTGRGNRRADDT